MLTPLKRLQQEWSFGRCPVLSCAIYIYIYIYVKLELLPSAGRQVNHWSVCKRKTLDMISKTIHQDERYQSVNNNQFI